MNHRRSQKTSIEGSFPVPEPRVSAKLKVRFGTDTGKALADFSVNLSTGGIFLETECLMPPETPLFLEFQLPDAGSTIQCRGRVAWVNTFRERPNPKLPVGMGVQFIGLGLGDLSLLREYVQRNRILSRW